MKIIDAHSHIDYITYKYQPGVSDVICCTTNEKQWPILIDMIKHNNNIHGAFGIHPWFVDSVQNNFCDKLEQLLHTDSRYMIGEVGLDKYKPNMNKQIDIFTKQLELAIKLKRTIFVHCTGAWDKMLHILKQYKKYDVPIIVMHAFKSNVDILSQLLEYKNIMFSFNKIDMCAINSCIERIPVDRILIESDGKNSSNLTDLMQQVIDIKNDVNISNIIYNNTFKVISNG